MTQKDKELLLKDLCARLPYHVIVELDEQFKFNKGTHTLVKELLDLYCVDGIKPYLRPMSSMTEEEFESLKEFSGLKYNQLELSEWNSTCKTLEFYLEEIPSDVVALVFDWLNANHFDYRGLIPMGLALVALEGMYETK